MSSQSSTENTSALEAVGLSRAFGSRKAVDAVTFSLEPGECLAVFGPNGAGKTTLLKLLAGLLRPTSGEALVRGARVAGSPANRARLGFISHHTMLYSALSPRENVTFAARLYSVTGVRERVDASLARMSMLDRSDTPVRSLSRGMQQRVSIARAMVHDPAIVLADEPYNGLDESGAGALTNLLQELRGAGTTLVIVTHNIAEGLALATQTAIMNRGRFALLERAHSRDPGSFAQRYREAIASG